MKNKDGQEKEGEGEKEEEQKEKEEEEVGGGEKKGEQEEEEEEEEEQQQQQQQYDVKWIGIGSITTFLVVIVSVLLAVPQPKLDWKGVVVPSANRYRMGFDDNYSVNSRTPLKGLKVVITGATSGIGFGLTKAMVRLGANVAAVSKDSAKLADLKKNVFLSPSIRTFVADYRDLDTVKKVADDILSSYDKIDILINNVGIHEGMDLFSKPETVQGFDNAFQVNYLAHFVLTEKLIPLLRKSPKPTIVQMSSSFHWLGNYVDLLPRNTTTSNNDEIQLLPPIASEPGGAHGFVVFRTQRGYGNTKLAQILMARALQRKKSEELGPKGRVISICPAWVGSSIAATPGTLAHDIFKSIAFELDGWGIASTLYGIFYHEEEDERNIYTGKKEDYFSNTRFLNIVTFPPSMMVLNSPWTYMFAMRDAVSWFMGTMVLFLQRLKPVTEPMNSAPVTYNEQIQDEFYDWTKEAVSKWIQ